MNKIFILLLISCCIPFFLPAQYARQLSIVTDDGIFSVSQTDDGKDMISFNITLWNDMVKGTKFVSKNLNALSKKKICIHISNKHCMHCTAGIGFRCGIFDCVNLLDRIPAIVNNENRICSIKIIQQDTATVKLIFLDKVDWYSLQNDQ